MRRLALRREALAELTAGDLHAVRGAGTVLDCAHVSGITRCDDVCRQVLDDVRELTTAIAVTTACPETR